MGASSPERSRIALVLSGGGARGAYEAGVLRYLRHELPPKVRVCFDIICGTSVGAVNGCYVAATACDGATSDPDLADLWQELSLEQVYRFGVRSLLSLSRSLLSPQAAPELQRPGGLPRRIGGILDTTPLERMVVQRLPWRRIHENIRGGVLHALSVSATDIATGKTVVFVEARGRRLPPWSRDPAVKALKVRISPVHVLASAAIPLVFPSVRIHNAYYCDGGLRQATPLSPALRLGADRALVIGLKADPPNGNGGIGRQRLVSLSKPAYLFGKVLNALLLDHVDYDLDRLRRFNALLDAGERAFGKEFYRRLDRVMVRLRGARYRRVGELYLKPSRDIGAIAARHVHAGKTSLKLQGFVAWLLKRMAAWGAPEGEADLLSYLLFDRAYARELIDLGMEDASARRQDLIAFFQ